MKSILVLLRHTEEQFKNDNKYTGITEALRKLNYDVYYTYRKDGEIFLAHNGTEKSITKRNLLINDKNSLLFNSVRALFASGFKTDYVYMRYMPHMPSIVGLFKAIKRSGSKLVVEIPTYPIDKEIKSDKRVIVKIAYPILKKVEQRASKLIDLYAIICEKSDSYNSRPAINIENGIDADSIPTKVKINNSDEIHILCLAKMARWHGYDRLIKGLGDYYTHNNKRNIFIHFVGPDGDGSLNEWEKLTDRLNLNEYIEFVGPKYGNALNEYIDKCDIGCDSLAMYLKGLNITSSLKIREYTARGLPFIISTPDDALKEDLPFYMMVSNDDTIINIEEVIAFVNKTRNIDNLSETMHQYAKEKMTWEKQMQKIFDYLGE